jgi:hypothetical protein
MYSIVQNERHEKVLYIFLRDIELLYFTEHDPQEPKICTKMRYANFNHQNKKETRQIGTTHN